MKETHITFESNSKKIAIGFLDNAYCYNPAFDETWCKDSILQQKVEELRDNEEYYDNDFDDTDMTTKLKNLFIDYEKNYQIDKERRTVMAINNIHQDEYEEDNRIIIEKGVIINGKKVDESIVIVDEDQAYEKAMEEMDWLIHDVEIEKYGEYDEENAPTPYVTIKYEDEPDSFIATYTGVNWDIDRSFDTIFQEDKDSSHEQDNDGKVYLATTATGIDVYIESETFEHMQAHPDVDLEVVKEAISKIDDITTETPFRIGSTNLGRTIGKDNCVEINSEDKVEMLYRKNRDGQTPVILNGEKADTSLVTVGICLDQGKHTMFTAFYGQLAPKEPWDERIQNPAEKAEAEKFWSTHALVLEPDAIDFDKSNPTEDKRVENLANDILNKNPAKSEAYIVNPFKVMDEHKQTKTNDNKEERSGKNGPEDISI